MENMKNKNLFLISCVSCIVLILTFCYFGIDVSWKGTYSSAVGSIISTSTNHGYTCANFTNQGTIKVGDTTHNVCFKFANTLVYYSADAHTGDSAEHGFYTCVVDGLTTEDRTPYIDAGWDCDGKLLDTGYFYTCSIKDDMHLDSVTNENPCWGIAADTYKVKYSKSAKVEGIQSNIPDDLYEQQISDQRKYTILDVKPTSQYYEFKGWSLTDYGLIDNCASNCKLFQPGDVISISKEDGWNIEDNSYTLTLYAVFGTRAKFSAIFTTVGGTLDGKSGNVEVSCPNPSFSCLLSESQIPKPVWSGYTFMGWGTDRTCSQIVPDMTKESIEDFGQTYHACWGYRAKFEIGYGDYLDGSEYLFCLTNGDSCKITNKIPTAEREGYIFKGWGNVISCTLGSTSELKVNRDDQTFYACWENKSTGVEKPTASSYCKTDLVYNGSSQDLTKAASTGYTFSNNAATNAGSYTVTAKLKSGYVWKDNTSSNVTFTCSIKKAKPTLTLSASKLTVNEGKENTFTERANVAGTFKNTSSKTNTATVSPSSNSGISANTTKTVKVTGVKEGTSTVTVEFTPTDTTNYEKVSSEIAITVQKVNSETPREKPFVATFDANGGVLSGNGTKSCKTTGSSCDIDDLPSATRDGYTFTGWGTSSSCPSGEKNKLTLSKNTTYYACYSKNQVAPPEDDKTPDDDKNVTNNPTTGDVAIAVTWFVGMLAIGYSFYYFKSVKEN